MVRQFASWPYLHLLPSGYCWFSGCWIRAYRLRWCNLPTILLPGPNLNHRVVTENVVFVHMGQCVVSNNSSDMVARAHERRSLWQPYDLVRYIRRTLSGFLA